VNDRILEISVYCQIILISVIFYQNFTKNLYKKKLNRYGNSSCSLLCSAVVLHIAKKGGAAELCKSS